MSQRGSYTEVIASEEADVANVAKQISNEHFSGTDATGKRVNGFSEAVTSTRELSGDNVLDFDNMDSVRRRYYLNYDFSLDEAKRNPDVTSWKVNSENYHIFQKKVPGSQIHPDSMAPRVGDLSKVLILEAKIYSVHSDAPVAVAVQMPGMKGNGYTNAGVRAPIMIPPHTTATYPGGHIVHKLPAFEARLSELRYTNINEEYFANEFSPLKDNPDYSLVARDSLIRDCMTRPKNMEKLGLDASKIKLITAGNEGKQYFIIQTKLANACKEVILKKCKNMQLPTTNLFNMECRLVPCSGISWDDIETNTSISGSSKTFSEHLFTKRNNVSVELELKYIIASGPEWDKATKTNN